MFGGRLAAKSGEHRAKKKSRRDRMGKGERRQQAALAADHTPAATTVPWLSRAETNVPRLPPTLGSRHPHSLLSSDLGAKRQPKRHGRTDTLLQSLYQRLQPLLHMLAQFRHLMLAQTCAGHLDEFLRHLTMLPGYHVLHHLLHRRRALWRAQPCLHFFVHGGSCDGSDMGVRVEI